MSLKILILLRRSERRVYSSGQKNTQEIIAEKLTGYVALTSNRSRWYGLRKLFKVQYLDSRGMGTAEGPGNLPLQRDGSETAKSIAQELQC
jgi:hypothetical protein